MARNEDDLQDRSVRWARAVAFTVLCLNLRAARQSDARLEHGTAVVFEMRGDHAAIAADTGTLDPRDGFRREDRCKIGVLSDPAALIGVGGAVVLGDERWALDMLTSAVREHRPINKDTSYALLQDVRREMEAQMRRYPVIWGEQVDLQGVVILPAEQGKGFIVLVFQAAQRVRKGDLSLDVKHVDLSLTGGHEYHGALEMGEALMHEIDEVHSDRGLTAADELRWLHEPREYATRAVEYAKRWYPENVFGTIDTATLDSGVSHLYRSTACSRPGNMQ